MIVSTCSLSCALIMSRERLNISHKVPIILKKGQVLKRNRSTIHAEAGIEHVLVYLRSKIHVGTISLEVSLIFSDKEGPLGRVMFPLVESVYYVLQPRVLVIATLLVLDISERERNMCHNT